MQKLKYLTLLPIIGLAACGGGSGSGNGTQRDIAPTRPSAQVSGTGFDGLILEGDVAVSGFNGAVAGDILGTAKTDLYGSYTASLQSPDTSILIKVDGGRYIEEASNTQIQLERQLNHRLYAVDYYKSGSAIEVSATFFTTLATGLTEYLVHKQGLSTEVAIERAYAEIDAWAGFDTRRTTPLAVNDAANASPLLTNALKAGFVAAGISQLTRSITTGDPHTKFFSIGFIQVAYEDIKADGILDGIGNGGDPLSYGTLLINADTYRTLLGTRLLQFVTSDYNQTSLGFDDLVGYATQLNQYNGELFNYTSAPDLNDTTPSISNVTPTSATVIKGSTTLSASVADIFGIASVEFRVNGESIATLTQAPYSYAFDATAYLNGIYPLETVVTNLLGNTSTNTRNLNINNGVISFSVPTGAIEATNVTSGFTGTCSLPLTVRDTTGLGVTYVNLDGNRLLTEDSIAGGAKTVSFSQNAGMAGSCRHYTVDALDHIGNSYSQQISVYTTRSALSNKYRAFCYMDLGPNCRY